MKRNQFVLLLVIFTISLTSCKSNGIVREITSVTDTDTAETTILSETSELLPDIPDITFDGYKIVFFVRGEEDNEWQSREIYAETENGEPINDAVYTRNLYLEEKYDVKIAQRETSDIAGAASKEISAGDANFDVIMERLYSTANLLSRGGFIADLNDLSYIDVSKPWWDQSAVEQLTLAGKRFMLTGDLSIMVHDATWILMFNKDMIEAFSLDSPYTIVNENNWTMDTMYDMMKNVSADINGDGVISPLDDRLGLATHNSSVEGFFFGSGLNVVTKDKNDLPNLSMNNEKLIGVLEKSIQLMADPDVTFNSLSNRFGLKGYHEHLRPAFEGGHALFFGEVLQCVTRLRTMETDFGVLPYPKYDETQSDFSHYVNSTASVLSVPKTNSDLERTGIIIEAMAAKSVNTLKKAYYDLCLEGKFMRDTESEEMLDIILNTRSFDIGYILGWGGLFDAYRSCVLNASTDFISTYTSKESSAIAAMNESIEIWSKTE